MDDSQIHGAIEKMVAEEHELWQREAGGDASDSDRSRLSELEIALDQCWDLLRQRRALPDAGRNPEGAQLRVEGGVGRYLQWAGVPDGRTESTRAARGRTAGARTRARVTGPPGRRRDRRLAGGCKSGFDPVPGGARRGCGGGAS